MMLGFWSLAAGDMIRHHAQKKVWIVTVIETSCGKDKNRWSYELMSLHGNDRKWLVGGTIRNLYVRVEK